MRSIYLKVCGGNLMLSVNLHACMFSVNLGPDLDLKRDLNLKTLCN